MDRRPPRPTASVQPAHWLIERVDPLGRHRVTSMVGLGFGAYARLLHPLDDRPGSSTWASVSRANDRVMHPSVQWEKIRAPASLSSPEDSLVRRYPGEPRRGQLERWALEELCAVLARHTAPSQICYFAVLGGAMRDGTVFTIPRVSDGVLRNVPSPRPAPACLKLDMSGPTFSFPTSGDSSYYHLFEGPVGDATQIGHWMQDSFFRPQSPHFFWSADHSWCVATEHYQDSTVIGGAADLIDELCATAALEVLRIAPDAPFEDLFNL